MRHMKSGRKLGRTSSHRKAMFRNMSCSLIEHQLIKTTVPKAKEIRRVIEPLITLAKKDSVANRRLAFAKLNNKQAVKTLFEELGPRFADRPGGYLRIVKCGFRQGDSAPMAIVQLLNEECKPKAKKAKKAEEKKPAKKKAEKEAVEATEEVVAEEAAAPEAVEVTDAVEEAPAQEAAPAKDADKKDAE